MWTVISYSRKPWYIKAMRRRSPMSKKVFTEEEMKQLLSNPYTARVTPHILLHTLEFKKFYMKEHEAGTTVIEIYRKAGYEPEMLGISRIKRKGYMIQKEAASVDGLKPVSDQREAQLAALAKADLSKEATEKAIAELQAEVLRQGQEIEFLKKILSLRE